MLCIIKDIINELNRNEDFKNRYFMFLGPLQLECDSYISVAAMEMQFHMAINILQEDDRYVVEDFCV